MGEVKHAAGPWFRRAHGMIGQGWTVYGEDRVHTTASGDRLTISPGIASVSPSPEREANARLIAAAPDHHDAARALDRLSLVILAAVNYADKGNLEAVSAALKANRAAIARATGSDQ